MALNPYASFIDGRDPMECQFLIHNGKGDEMFMVPFSELIKKVPARARH